MRRVLLILPVLVAWIACSDRKTAQGAASAETGQPVAATQSNGDSLLFFYKRTPCFGWCRTFELTVYQSGYAVYKGESNVDMIGLYHSNVPASALLRVKETVKTIDYFRLQDEYNMEGVTDLPSTYTTVNLDGNKKSVHDRYRGPDSLDQLYKALDEVVSESNWTKD